MLSINDNARFINGKSVANDESRRLPHQSCYPYSNSDRNNNTQSYECENWSRRRNRDHDDSAISRLVGDYCLPAQSRNSFCFEAQNVLKSPRLMTGACCHKRNSWGGSGDFSGCTCPALYSSSSPGAKTKSSSILCRYAEILNHKVTNGPETHQQYQKQWQQVQQKFSKVDSVNNNVSKSEEHCASNEIITSPIEIEKQFALLLSRESFFSLQNANDGSDDVDADPDLGLDLDSDDDCGDPRLYGDQNNEINSISSYATPCDINLTERLIRCHPIWFLPDIQRSGAIHLLQGKEAGNYIVRKSSQPGTMALSVRLPTDNGPYIEHYLIQAKHGKLSLETSDNTFDSVPDLISHYCQCCDELPVQLCLPEPLSTVKTRKQLTSLALLGQEFWRYSKSKNNSEVSGNLSSPSSDVLVNNYPIFKTFKNFENPIRKAVRPSTLNLTNNNAKSLLTLSNTNSSFVKTPPIPPPRWVNITPSTPDNINRELITAAFDTVSQTYCEASKQSNESSDAKNHSFSTSSSQEINKDSSAKKEVLSPMLISSPLSIISPSSISMLSSSLASSSRKNSKQTRNLTKDSKHYQESDILDASKMYRYKRQEDKTSDCGSMLSPELLTFKTNNCPLITSPDLIPNRIVSLNDNVLSPAGSQCDTTSYVALVNEEVAPNTTSAECLFSAHNSDYGSTKFLMNDFSAPSRTACTLYAQPADAIRWKSSQKEPLLKRFFRNSLVLPGQRYSNPPRIYSDSSKENLNVLTNTMSSSADNLYDGKNKSKWNLRCSDSWQVDSNWHFFNKMRQSSNLNIKKSSNIITNTNTKKSHECEKNLDACDSQCGFSTEKSDCNEKNVSSSDSNSSNSSNDRFNDNGKNEAQCPVEESQKDESVSLWVNSFPPLPVSTHYLVPSCCSSRVTVHRLIVQKNPELNVPEIFNTNQEDVDSSSQISAHENRRHITSSTHLSSEMGDCSNFSEPCTESCQNNLSHRKYCENCGNCNTMSNLANENVIVIATEQSAGRSIRNYTLLLGKDKQTTFSRNIENFISCTKESKETNPQIVMRNIRQFMSGMKNYLVKHGEKGFQREVERERRKLNPNEFLNLDSILENVLHHLVIEPLRTHLLTLFVEHFSENGSVRLLVQNIKFAQSKSAEELGIRSELVLPSSEELRAISRLLNKLQLANSPLEKLDFLLSATAKIFDSVKTVKSQTRSLSLGADDFLPILVWVIAKTNFIAAEIESEYMWGLLNQSMLSGEGGYYLTTLSSAVDVLKNIQNSVDNMLSLNLEGSSVIKVIVPNELQGSILTKTLPVKSNMNTKQICKIIAHKARITNPQDYALYRLIDDKETLLMENDCPQNFRSDKHCLLVYKRTDAKIAWPKT